jgi:hypothetical protein
MGKLAKNDQEDDQAWDPGIALISVHNLISEKRDQEGCGCDDQNAGPARHIAIHSIEQLGAHNDIDSGPADTSKDVKNGNCSLLALNVLVTFRPKNMSDPDEPTVSIFHP